MISSHQTTTETITNSYLLNNSSNNLYRSAGIHNNNLQVNKRQIGDKSINLPLSGIQQRRIFGNIKNISKPTGIAIPLTKNLSKISQSSGSLVDSIAEPIVHTYTDNNCSNEEIYNKSELINNNNNNIVDSEKTPRNSDHNFNYDNINYNDDDDDNIQKVLNKTSELINNLLSGSSSGIGGGNNDSNSKSLDIHENNLDNNNNNINKTQTQCINNAVNHDDDKMSRHKYKLHVNSTDTDEEDNQQRKVSDVNLNIKTFAKSLDNVNEIDIKQQQQQQHLSIQQQSPPPTASPKLTYSRAKLLSHNQQASSTSPNQSPKFANKNIADATVTTSSDGKLNVSPSTKHRPLSAASISSSSSSTSSASSSNSFGNEHLTGGVNRQYLASIESLADHSENEVNPSLTMCERAALEIVDSERCFVEDLGQIIQG